MLGLYHVGRAKRQEPSGNDRARHLHGLHLGIIRDGVYRSSQRPRTALSFVPNMTEKSNTPFLEANSSAAANTFGNSVFVTGRKLSVVRPLRSAISELYRTFDMFLQKESGLCRRSLVFLHLSADTLRDTVPDKYHMQVLCQYREHRRTNTYSKRYNILFHDLFLLIICFEKSFSCFQALPETVRFIRRVVHAYAR